MAYGTASQRKAFESRAQLDAFTVDDQPSAFTDTMSAAWALTRREELSTSAARAWADKNIERAAVIGQLGGDEQLARAYSLLPREILPRLRQAELDGDLTQSTYWQVLPEADREAYLHVREFERQYPDQVKSDDTLFEEFKAKAAELRARETNIMQRGSGWATFLGTGGAVMTDPLVLSTLPLGAPEFGAGRTLWSAIARTAAIEGSIAMATEIPIQAAVMQFKQELEAPWTFRDSAINVLSAGAGGFVLGGAIHGGVEGTRAFLRSYREAREAGRVTPTPEMDEAEQVLEDSLAVADENPLDPELGRLGEEVHEGALGRARAQAELGEPIDVAEQVRGFEAPDPIDRVVSRMDDPTELVDLDPAGIQVDARTFQFKSGGDAEGVTDTLRDVQRFDRRLAGVALIWENNAGERFIADGHQRLALAQRALAAGQDPAEVRLNGFILREADGVTAADARRMAAIKNMAEGSGSALDAAKILREVGDLGDALLPPLPPRSALVRQARGLAELDEEAFMQVVNGVVDARFGAIVGQATDNPDLQQAMIRVLQKVEPANEIQARSIVDQVKTQGVEVRKTEDLFGEQSFAESLYLERAQVLDAALREARRDRAVFGRLVSDEGRIQQAGRNRLDRAANEQRIQEATDAATKISALANAKGELSEALTEAARAVREGQQPARAARAFLKAARREILEGNRGRAETGRARSGADTAGARADDLDVAPGRPVRLADLPPERQPDAVQAFKGRQAGQSVEELYAVAETHQKALRDAADEIAAELGEDIEIADPGIKIRQTAEEKITRKGLTDAGELTDVIRLGFMVETPDLAARIIERLGQRFELLDEGVTVTGMGYLDHKALVRFGDGRVGEVQLWDRQMARAKFGEGTELYERVRTISAEDMAKDPALRAQMDAATEASKDLYARAIAAANPEWRRVAMMRMPEDMRARVQSLLEGGGSAGVPGNVSRKADRPSSTPDSNTSTGKVRDQAEPPDGTKKASEPPSGVSRTTAGRASQLKNRSAIDAPPRSIVRHADDKRSAQPQPSRTGTVDDEQYAAVMAQFADVSEELGEQLRVASDVDGVLSERSARAAIEELDTLEDTLERIRACSVPSRDVA